MSKNLKTHEKKLLNYITIMLKTNLKLSTEQNMQKDLKY